MDGIKEMVDQNSEGPKEAERRLGVGSMGFCKTGSFRHNIQPPKVKFTRGGCMRRWILYDIEFREIAQLT